MSVKIRGKGYGGDRTRLRGKLHPKRRPDTTGTAQWMEEVAVQANLTKQLSKGSGFFSEQKYIYLPE
jgi:hypothetical protein